MKTKFIFSTLIASLLVLLSCKDDKKGDSPVDIIKSNNFEVELDLVIEKDDSLQVFYRDEAIPTFGEENSIWVAVKGSHDSQKIKFSLPEPIVPTHLRFDISKNVGQSPIVLNNFKMMFKDKSYEAKDSTMIYFQTNDQLKYDPANKSLTQIKVEGQGYDPFISSSEILTAKIKNFIR